ncbi:aspartyl-tRNA synthetase [Bacillus sp. JJ1566]|uniref:aspartyl-tRNA synthetase n=1 Tax=Bacillus sp. JJ1566 TaxID=3122961 RepID=UPI002FFF3D04
MKKRSLVSVVFIFIIISIIWIMSEKSDSYSEPQEAIFAIDHDLVLIPGYKSNGKALFFFIKDTNNVGATYVQEGIFGWKADTLTWSPMDFARNYEKLSGYQGYGEKLVYGLIKHGDERLIQIGENQARILNLEMLPPAELEKFHLEGLYIWYFESDQPLNGGEIKLLDKSTDEELDTIVF